MVMLIALLTACGTAAVDTVSGPGAAAAYGNITMPVGSITNVMLYKVGETYVPPFKSPPSSHTYRNGTFFFENLEPGKYYLVGFTAGQEAFYFNFRGIEEVKFIDEMAIDIEPGSAVYLGSYEVVGLDRNFFKTDNFDIKLSKRPSKFTILRQLVDGNRGTGWDVRFKQEMK